MTLAVVVSDLRPARKNLGLTLTDVADALDCAISKISLIERGTIRDTRFLDRYRAWAQRTRTPPDRSLTTSRSIRLYRA